MENKYYNFCAVKMDSRWRELENEYYNFCAVKMDIGNLCAVKMDVGESQRINIAG